MSGGEVMNRETLLDGLFAVAFAYLERGSFLQYDQLSPDRILRVTKRKREMLPPEAATPQRTLYSDCASFVWSAFYHAFGHEIESGVTWNMIDYGTPRICYRELTHNEPEAEIAAMRVKLQKLLMPGDVIVYQYENGNGHAMLYLDEKRYINCTQRGTFAGYHYESRQEKPQPDGGMIIEDADGLFYPQEDTVVAGRNYLFADRVRRYAVLRPLDLVTALTPDTKARIGSYRGLFSYVECDHAGARAADTGECVTYTLTVQNKSDREIPLQIAFQAPSGTENPQEDAVSRVLPAGKTERFSFPVRVHSVSRPLLEQPHITVNGMRINAPRVHTGTLSPKRNPSFPGDLRLRLHRLFCRIDSVQGDVLVRRTQKPDEDGAVYGMFGGTGVITPETLRDGDIRATQVTVADFMDNDILVTADDAGFGGARAYTYRDGAFHENGTDKTMTAEEGARLVDSLPGGFCFVLLRPSYLADDQSTEEA